MEREDLLRAIYDAFNARDIDAVLRHMGTILGEGRVLHVFTFRDDLITRMDVVELARTD